MGSLLVSSWFAPLWLVLIAVDIIMCCWLFCVTCCCLGSARMSDTKRARFTKVKGFVMGEMCDANSLCQEGSLTRPDDCYGQVSVIRSNNNILYAKAVRVVFANSSIAQSCHTRRYHLVSGSRIRDPSEMQRRRPFAL
jgi:hypothetical protein